jgi:acetyl-CoA acetyltransferase
VDVLELNEAFAAQVLACLAKWKTVDPRVNPTAVALRWVTRSVPPAAGW